MMKAYEASKGVGWGKLPDPPTAAPAMNLNTKEEYDAYMKWCEENKAKLAQQQKQQELLDAWRAREAQRKKDAEKAKAEADARERRENQMDMSAVFDTISAQVTEVKHKYYEMVALKRL